LHCKKEISNSTLRCTILRTTVIVPVKGSNFGNHFQCLQRSMWIVIFLELSYRDEKIVIVLKMHLRMSLSGQDE
jgi:hypothetical protein